MRKQPLNFRQEEVAFITERWKAIEQVSLVGVGSVGKSNLIHHLADPDVHQKYLGRTPDQFRSIVIDPNLLGPLPKSGENVDQFTCWAGFELIMHRLYMSFYPFESMDDITAQRFYESYSALQDGTNPLYSYMGLRYLEMGLRILIHQGFQIVLMFDEFEELLQIMPPKFFQVLRGLRDSFKSNLSFLTFTRSPIPALLKEYGKDYQAMEPFIELFTDNIIYVGPYNNNDAVSMLNTLIRRNPKANYPEHVLDFLLYATGRYAGILRASFRMLDTLGEILPSDVNSTELVQKLALRPPVKSECNTIWLSLSPVEQRVLKAVARLNPYDANENFDEAIKTLVQKRLLYVDRQSESLTIQPPVFRSFIQTNPDSKS